MKKLSRRQFAQLAGAAALATPFAPAAAAHVGAGFSRPSADQQSGATSSPEPKLKLTPDQEERVRQAVERRDRQLNALRSRTLPYSLEPAFVFAVRQRPRSGRKS